MLDLIEQNRPQIEALCRKSRVVRLDLFGSAARGDFDLQRSDLDFLVEFEDIGWQGSSGRYFDLLHGLEDLLHRKIDLVERDAVTNPYFLEVADAFRQTVYAAEVTKAS
jgi:predicted nucleotidyltransferase